MLTQENLNDFLICYPFFDSMFFQTVVIFFTAVLTWVLFKLEHFNFNFLYKNPILFFIKFATEEIRTTVVNAYVSGVASRQ